VNHADSSVFAGDVVPFRRRVFISVGSLHFPFERLVRAAGRLEAYDLVAQHGTGNPPPGAVVAMPYLSYDEMLEQMMRADIVVCHAGVGTVILAMQLGHTPVVMPRLRRFGETVDDHQLALVRRLGTQGLVIAIEHGDELEAAVRRVPARREVRTPRRTALQRAVRDALIA